MSPASGVTSCVLAQKLLTKAAKDFSLEFGRRSPSLLPGIANISAGSAHKVRKTENNIHSLHRICILHPQDGRGRKGFLKDSCDQNQTPSLLELCVEPQAFVPPVSPII